MTETVNMASTKHAKDPTKRVVSLFKQNKLRLLHADKNGGFVILRVFNEKAGQAIAKNFVRVKPIATRITSRAAALCSDLELSRLTNSITSCKMKALSIFITATMLKDSKPLTMVSEKGSWQLLISQYLLEHLSALQI